MCVLFGTSSLLSGISEAFWLLYIDRIHQVHALYNNNIIIISYKSLFSNRS